MTITDNPVICLAGASVVRPRKRFFFAGRNDGLYRSANVGRSWEQVWPGALPVVALAVSPNFSRDQTLFAGFPGGLLHSRDGGQQWKLARLQAPTPFILTLAISPNFAHDGVVLAGTEADGCLRSEDGGLSWSAWNFGLVDLEVLCLSVSPDFAKDKTCFAGTGTGLFRSYNGGRSWQEVTLPLDQPAVLSLATSPSYVNDGVVFAGVENGGLLCSRDGGETWKRLEADRLTGSVNALAIIPTHAHLELALLHEQELLLSEADLQVWRAPQLSQWEAEPLSALATWLEDGSETSLLLGFENGQVLQLPALSGRSGQS